jgi:hypothetical protein
MDQWGPVDDPRALFQVRHSGCTVINSLVSLMYLPS